MEEFSKKDLREMICQVLKIEKTNTTIEGQIHKYVMELGLSYKEIAQALVFFVEVEQGAVEPKYGIAIVPHVVDRAKSYFANLKRQKEKQIQSVKDANNIPDILLEVKEIKKRRKIAKIDINEIDVD